MVQRRRLRTELRRARQAAELTQEQVVAAMDWSLSKIIRIESGSVGISTNDLRALLRLYGVSDPARLEDLVELARTSRQPSWWGKYRDGISSKYLQFIEYEEAASIIRVYEPLILPGLLQTEAYARAVIQELGSSSDISEDTAEARVAARIARQELLGQENAPRLAFVIDEAAIRRLTGQRELRQSQTARLIEMARRPNVTIEIVPFSAGLHRGMVESFIILEFPDPEDSDILFLESSRDLIFSQDEAGEIGGYREVFEHLRSISLGPEGSLAFLTNFASEAP
jgi:transcriptional regulator with XRE-family HTH domain